ncbi:MAG TPA: recombination mediator RecR [Bacteroidota bacterium]|nr:recombination mediator RecR [Bacteroidota bacterium]
MVSSPDSLQRLIEEFAKLPGIGRKSAQRLALYILKQPTGQVREMAGALLDLKEKMKYCSICWNFTEVDPCLICSSPRRDAGTICVVEEPSDVLAIERTSEYRGFYHVLGGSLSPLEGVGPEEIRVRELIARIGVNVHEVILALSATIEGEATTIYLTKLLKPPGVRVTRLARGIPVGGDLEFTDEATLARALEGRVPV